MLRVLVRAGLAIAGLLLGLALSEGLVRAFLPQDLVTGNLRFAAHPGPGFRLQPDTYLPGENGGPIGSLGLRGEDLPARAAGEHRVLVLGDSFTYGSGVREAETFVARLQRLVTAPGWRFVNGGTPAYGTYRQARWLDAFGEEVAPDEVLLAFFVGNDFTDNLTCEDPVVFDGRLVGAGIAEDGQWRLRLRIALEGSHLYRLLDRRLDKPEPPSAEVIEFVTDPDRIARARAEKEERFLQTEVERMLVYRRSVAGNEMTERAYAESERALGRVRDWCRSRGVALCVVILPDVVQVDPGLFARVFEQLPDAEPERADRRRPQRFLADWCAREGVRSLDLLDVLVPHGGAAYLEHDTHLSSEGHRVTAEAIAAELYASD